MFPAEAMRYASAAAAAQVDIFDMTCFKGGAVGPKTASYGLGSDGIGYKNGVNTWTWLLSGVNSDYQVRATLVSGDTPNGDTLGGWLSLGTTRAWSLTVNPGPGSSSCVLTVEIRRISDNAVIDTASITIDVEVG